MTILRSEKQVALQELLVVLRETTDLFRDTANYLDDAPVSRPLQRIAEERETFFPALERLIEEEGDLPKVPDEDRETGIKLLGRLFASVASNTTGEVLMDRIKGEEHLDQAISHCLKAGVDSGKGHLLTELEQHARQSHDRLQELLSRYHD